MWIESTHVRPPRKVPERVSRESAVSQFLSHWCTICLSVAVWLLMHPRCRQAIALFVSDA